MRAFLTKRPDKDLRRIFYDIWVFELKVLFVFFFLSISQLLFKLDITIFLLIPLC